MGTRRMNSAETKIEVIKLHEEGLSYSEIQEVLGIKNKTQISNWIKWYREDEIHRFYQPVGKQYTFGNGPEGSTTEETLKMHNKSLKQQVELLKKYAGMEKRWYWKY